jgi:ribosomal protein S12 methylthiotransferase accessory factor YcaO
LGFDLDAATDVCAAELRGVSLHYIFRDAPVLFEYQRSRIGQYPGRCPLPRALRVGRTRCIGAGNGKLARQTRSYSDPVGYRIWWGVSPERKEAPLISLRGLPRPAATLVRKLQRAGLEVQLQNLTSGTGIATIGCTIAEPPGLPIVMNAHSGCGTHPDARIALTRALTEAAQTRLTCIQGGREDLPGLARTSGAAPAETWYNGGQSISFDDIASYQHPTINDDVEFIVERMRQSGFDQVVVFDVTREELGIPVVRVVVPRTEAWTLYFMHSGRASLGQRVLQQIEGEPK